MLPPLATVERLAARVAEAIETPEEIALAQEMLEAASAEVRHYGRNWPTAEQAPAVAVTITVAAAARGYLNPGGFQMERADAMNLTRGDEYIAGTALTPEERNMLKTYSRRGGVVSAALHNDIVIDPRSAKVIRDRGYAPSHDGTKPYPLGVDP